MKYKENSEVVLNTEETAKENLKSPEIPTIKDSLIELIVLDMKIVEKCFENIKNTLQTLSYLNENDDKS